jgi:hypothetical protein
MRAAELRDVRLAFPGSVETFPFGPQTSAFKVAGKIFALTRLAEAASSQPEMRTIAPSSSARRTRPCSRDTTRTSGIGTP